MRVFISSVRRGLEEERDALPGLITALGHVPVRFEDFTARPVPSRQSCMDAVVSSDVCLLLLGPAYGDRMPDTGVSPTEEEFTAAQARGIPVYAFVKHLSEMDSDQRAFVERVEQYATGRFRASFAGATDLLTSLAQTLRNHDQRSAPVTWEQLRGPPPPVPWVAAHGDGPGYASVPATVELHVLPTAPISRLEVGHLDDLANTLAARGRELGLFTHRQPVNPGTDGTAAWARSEAPRTGIVGIRVARDGTVSLWWPLPSDNMGAVIDAEHLATDIASRLRLVAALGVLSGPRATIAAGLSGLAMASEGHVVELGRRSSVSLGFSQQDEVRVVPEDSVPVDALAHGADDVSREMAARVVHAFRRSRR